MTTIEAYHLIRTVFTNAGHTDSFVVDLIATIHSEAFGKGYKEGREQQEKVYLTQEQPDDILSRN